MLIINFSSGIHVVPKTAKFNQKQKATNNKSGNFFLQNQSQSSKGIQNVETDIHANYYYSLTLPSELLNKAYDYFFKIYSTIQIQKTVSLIFLLLLYIYFTLGMIINSSFVLF